MKKDSDLHCWMVKNLEEPFFWAEIYKTELQKCNDNDNCFHSVIATSVVLAMPLVILAINML